MMVWAGSVRFCESAERQPKTSSGLLYVTTITETSGECEFLSAMRFEPAMKRRRRSRFSSRTRALTSIVGDGSGEGCRRGLRPAPEALRGWLAPEDFAARRAPRQPFDGAAEAACANRAAQGRGQLPKCACLDRRKPLLCLGKALLTLFRQGMPGLELPAKLHDPGLTAAARPPAPRAPREAPRWCSLGHGSRLPIFLAPHRRALVRSRRAPRPERSPCASARAAP